MLTLALTALACSAPPQGDPLPKWAEAALVVGSERFALAERGADTPAAAAVDQALPEAWIPSGMRVVDQLELGAGADAPILVVCCASEAAAEVAGGPPGAAPAWRVTLESLPGLAGDPALLLAAAEPHRAVGEVDPLTRLGDHDVLVLAGERGHLLRLDSRTGAVEARLDAPWEIRRGFVGPSVWSVELCRFGDTDAAWREPDAAAVATARAAFEAHTLGWVVGGPVVSGERVFLAVAHAAAGPWAYQRAECSLLELTRELQPCSLTQLPGPVAPAATAPADGGVIWALHGGGYVRLDALATEHLYGMGPGGHDRRGALRWVTNRVGPSPAHFLIMGQVGATALFHGELALRPGRPYVPRDAHAVIRVPIEVVHLGTGRTAEAVVEVPLDRDATAPKTNFRGRDRAYELFGAGFVRLASLRVDVVGAFEQLVLVCQDTQRAVTLAAPAGVFARLAALVER